MKSKRNSVDKQDFKSPRKVEKYWNLHKKAIYVEKPQKILPAWFFPLLALVLITALIFWAAPTAISRLQTSLIQSNDDPAAIKFIYDSDTWVVKKTISNLFFDDDIKSQRVTQALYNEPVRILKDNVQWGFKRVELLDGTTGYMLTEDIVNNRQSIEPALAQYKIMVTSSSKNIMSHAKSGTLLAEAMMGTQLYADYRGDGILRIFLPDGGYGWVSEDGLLVLPPEETIKLTPDGARYFCISAMDFHHVTVLDQGQSRLGASIAGVARVAALVNGVVLPRSMDQQIKSGTKIEFTYLVPFNEESYDGKESTDTFKLSGDLKQPDLSIIRAGDLIFVDDKANPGQPVSMAIVMENGRFMMSSATKTAIDLVDPTQIPDWTSRIISIRRIFPDSVN